MENVKFSDSQFSSVVVNVVFSHTFFHPMYPKPVKEKKVQLIRTVNNTIDHRNYVHDLESCEPNFQDPLFWSFLPCSIQITNHNSRIVYVIG